jgi:hypothetical protein
MAARKRRVAIRGGRLSGPVFRGAQYTVLRPPNLPIYHNPSFQRGRGLGSFLAGLFRAAVPLFKSGAKAVGKQALASGIDLARDYAFSPSAREDPKAAFKHRLGQAGDALTEKWKEKVSRMTDAGQSGGRKRVTVRRKQRGSGKKRKQQRGGKIGSQQRNSRIKSRRVGSLRVRGGGKGRVQTPEQLARLIKRALNRSPTKRKKKSTAAATRSVSDVFPP